MCVEASAREDGHFRAKPKDEDKELEGNALPIISLDYQELDELADKPNKTIV